MTINDWFSAEALHRFEFSACGCLTCWWAQFHPDWHGSMPDSSHSSSPTTPPSPLSCVSMQNQTGSAADRQTRLEQEKNTFLGFVVSGFETLMNSEKWSKAYIESPLCQNIFADCPWGWNEKLPSCLIESHKERKMAMTECRLYVERLKLMFNFVIWFSSLLLWVDNNRINVSSLYQVSSESSWKGFLPSSSTLPLQLCCFVFHTYSIVKDIAIYFEDLELGWSNLGLILTDGAGAHRQLSSPGNIFHIVVISVSEREK